MSTQIWQSSLSKTAYKMADPAKWLIGNWKTLDPVLAGRAAYYAMIKGVKMILNECVRSSALQEVYYKEYLYYKRTGKLGPHGIKLAAAPGTSWHEINLAFDADDTHPIYHASNEELAQYGLCKPLVSKGEFWHIQPIETAKLGSKAIKSYGPTDLAPQLVKKFGFGETTLIYIRDYEYGSDFAIGLLQGKKDFSDATINYFKMYDHWEDFEKKVNIY